MPQSMSSGASDASPGHVLFVDDDADVLKAAALLLGRHGLKVSSARDPVEARSLLAAERVDVVLLDLNFTRGATSGEEGFRCLAAMLDDDPQVVVVVITGHSGISVAVRAMQAGASDFVMKPWNNARLLATVQDALALRRRRKPVPDLADEAVGEAAVEPTILGDSAAIGQVRDLVARVGPTGASVLVLGEAGSGKSLVARRLHLASPRRDGPFVAVDLSALSTEEAAAALFGDRLAGTAGALAEARAGTMVLEAAPELAASLQGRLLAALEGGGTDAPRIVSTTRRNRATVQGRGGLRDDLLFRLNTVEIVLPPLRARGRDALILAEHYLRLFSSRHGRTVKPLSEAAEAGLLQAFWPGDVRALRQAMERGVIFSEGPRCGPADLGLGAAEAGGSEAGPLDLRQSERALVAAALKRHGFNVSHAARDLGLTRAALYRRMAKHGL